MLQCRRVATPGLLQLEARRFILPDGDAAFFLLSFSFCPVLG
jgi:hypothetical protein